MVFCLISKETWKISNCIVIKTARHDGRKESFFTVTTLYHGFQECNVRTGWCIRKANILYFPWHFILILTRKNKQHHYLLWVDQTLGTHIRSKFLFKKSLKICRLAGWTKTTLDQDGNQSLPIVSTLCQYEMHSVVALGVSYWLEAMPSCSGASSSFSLMYSSDHYTIGDFSE